MLIKNTLIHFHIKDLSHLSFFIFTIIIVVIVSFWIKQSTSLSTHAMLAASTLEPENGVLSNNVALGNDAQASGGKYIQFQSPLRIVYVSPNGLDTNPGTQLQPWKTFYKAAQSAVAGDLVLFMDGQYTETQTISVANSGTGTNPIIFRSQNPQKAVIYFQNMAGKWRMSITGKPYIHIEDFEITGDNNIGIDGNDKFLNFFDGADYAVVRGNKIHHIYEDLVKVYRSDHVVIENNELYDVTNEAIDNMHNVGTVVRNNVIRNANRISIMMKGGSRNSQIYNNTIIQETGSMYVAIELGGSSDAIYAYDPSGYEGYNQVAWNNVVVAKNGAVIQEGLQLYGCDTCSFVNNVVVGADTAFSLLRGPGVSKGWTWEVFTRNPKFLNNIAIDCKLMQESFDTYLGTLTFDYNNVFNCPGSVNPFQPHGITTDPLFVDKFSNWHLLPGSPASGNGQTLPGFPTFSDLNTPPSPDIDVSQNLDGTTRTPPWNIGVY